MKIGHALVAIPLTIPLTYLGVEHFAPGLAAELSRLLQQTQGWSNAALAAHAQPLAGFHLATTRELAREIERAPAAVATDADFEAFLSVQQPSVGTSMEQDIDQHAPYRPTSAVTASATSPADDLFYRSGNLMLRWVPDEGDFGSVRRGIEITN